MIGSTYLKNRSHALIMSAPYKKLDHFLSTLSNSEIKLKKVLVITGGRAQMAPMIIKEALRRGHIIHSCTRHWPLPKYYHITWEKLEDNQLNNPKAWQTLFHRISKGADRLFLVNTLGTAVAPAGKTLSDINEKPILAAVEALQTLQIKKRIGHISSIAATYLPDDKKLLTTFDPQGLEYCLGRKRVDTLLEKNEIPTTILRPGFVFNDLSNGSRIDTGHDYSPEQFTELLVHPIIGSGKQMHQPVYIGDLLEGLFNGMETEKSHLVNAVGPEIMSQEDMIKFFLNLAQKPFKPVKIPYEVASIIAKYFPKGRLAPYSVSLLRHLEEQRPLPLNIEPFQNLVKKSLTSIGQIYKKNQNQTVIFTKSPILEHMKEIITCIAINPEARRDFITISTLYGPALILDAIKRYFGL